MDDTGPANGAGTTDPAGAPDGAGPRDETGPSADEAAANAGSGRAERLRTLVPLALVAALLLTALVAGLGQEEPDSDEYLYMNMARAWASGHMPYRDFFCAHPPGLLAPVALLFALFGPSALIAKGLAALATAAVFVLTYLLGRALWKDSPFPALFGVTLLLSSVLLHETSATYLGLGLSLALVMAGVLAHVRGRPAAAGLLLASAPLVRLAAAPLFLVFLFLAPDKKRYFAGAAAPLIAGVACLFLFPHFLEQTFWYHIDKTGMGLADRFAVLGSVLWSEKILLLLAAAGAVFAARTRERRVLLWAALVLAAFAAVQKVVFPYYFTPLLPFAALLGGAALWALLRGRLRPDLVFLPHLGLFALLALLHLGPVARGYRDDLSLRPAADELRRLAGPPPAHFLDLSGGAFGAYASFRTGLGQTGLRLDWNTQRLIIDGTERALADVRDLLEKAPPVVVTEIEPADRTVIWSAMRSVRAYLHERYHLEACVFHAPRGRLLQFWTPAPDPRPSVDVPGARPPLRIFRVSVTLEDGTARAYEERARWGLETDLLARFLNEQGGRVLVSPFVFADASTELLFPEDDLAERKAVTLRWIPIRQPEGGVRVLAESYRDEKRFRPLSFVDASFDRKHGGLRRLTLYAAWRGRFYPVVRIAPAPASEP